MVDANQKISSIEEGCFLSNDVTGRGDAFAGTKLSK